jgi:hypothetical protein
MSILPELCAYTKVPKCVAHLMLSDLHECRDVGVGVRDRDEKNDVPNARRAPPRFELLCRGRGFAINDNHD